jgi:MFS family permease
LVTLTYLLFERSGRSVKSDRDEPIVDTHEPEMFSRQMLMRIFSVIFITTAVGGIIFQSTTFALPKIMDERLGDLAGSATEIGLYTFLVFAVAAFAQLAVGYLIDRYSVRRIFGGLAFVQALLFVIMIPLTGLPALIVAFAFMLTVFGEIPINDVLVGRVAHREWRSRAYSISYIIGFSVSALAVPLIAWIHGGWGFGVLFGLLAGCAFVVFIAAFFLPPMRQNPAL